MFYELLLAVALITAPEQTEAENNNFAFAKDYVQVVAVQMELLDAREKRYILNRTEDFSSDLNLIRRRYAELHDAPHLGESERIIPREAINEMLVFNRAHRQYLENAQSLELHKWDDYDRMLRETEILYQIWDLARDAKCEYYYVTIRRQALKKMRAELGNEMFYSGQMPPFVPIWNFISR